MIKFVILSAVLFSFQVHAQTAISADEVRATCSNPANQLPAFENQAIKRDVQEKLDCLYLFVIRRSGGPMALLTSPKFRQTRISLMPVRSEILQNPAMVKALKACIPSLTTMDQIACVGMQNKALVTDLLLMRAVKEITLPSFLPPLKDPKTTTLDQFRQSHEAVFATLPMIR